MDGVRMRTFVWTALFAAACGGDNGFSTDENDPNTEVGTGVADFYPTELDFQDCEQDISYSLPFQIKNVGENTLTVYEISVIEGGLVFYVEDVDEFGLEPKESREFNVVATLTAPMTPTDGTLRIKTSDPEAVDFQMPLHADPAPEDSGNTDDSGTK
jgi:hypothetical protein